MFRVRASTIETYRLRVWIWWPCVNRPASQPAYLPAKVSAEPGPNNRQNWSPRFDKERLIYSGKPARICTRTEAVTVERVRWGVSATTADARRTYNRTVNQFVQRVSAVLRYTVLSRNNCNHMTNKQRQLSWQKKIKVHARLRICQWKVQSHSLYITECRCRCFCAHENGNVKRAKRAATQGISPGGSIFCFITVVK